jgi:hypothetical protein
MVVARLCNRAQLVEDEWVAWPGLETLAFEADLAESTTATAVSALVTKGVIRVEPAGPGGRGNSNHYILLTDANPPGTGEFSAGVNPPDQSRKPPGSRQKPPGSLPKTPREPGTNPINPIEPKGNPSPCLLPATSADGAGELAKGLEVKRIIEAVNERRRPPLTRNQAVAANALARDALAAGWDPRLVVAGLSTTSAFTMNAFTYAVDQLRRQTVDGRRSTLTKFEQSEDWA